MSTRNPRKYKETPDFSEVSFSICLKMCIRDRANSASACNPNLFFFSARYPAFPFVTFFIFPCHSLIDSVICYVISFCVYAHYEYAFSSVCYHAHSFLTCPSLTNRWISPFPDGSDSVCHILPDPCVRSFLVLP